VSAAPPAAPPPLPAWAKELVELYESGAYNQFVLHGNVQDLLLVGEGEAPLGSLTEFLRSALLPRHDIVLSYDLGNGVRILHGGEALADWGPLRDAKEMPRAPRAGVEWITQCFRYCANLARLGRRRLHVACLVPSAHLVAPEDAGPDATAAALLMRDWSSDPLLLEHPLATFLLTENLSELHPILAGNARAAQLKVPLPGGPELAAALRALRPRYPAALAAGADLDNTAAQLAGAQLASVQSLLRTREHRKQPVATADLSALKKSLIEKDTRGLIDFVESDRTLDDLYGLEPVKAWLRQDIALWKNGDIDALPKGYLVCGPVGTGKSFLVECLAGEAGIPVVKLKNFRDRWVGSTEGNLETIFRLLSALGRCYVFVDEADQALGRRESGTGDSGLSGRVYAMIAEEMGSSRSRGKVIWVLASSRPDLIEVDLKRPGRVDVKIPLFPTATREESLALLRALFARRKLALSDADAARLLPKLPLLLTPGAAEALAMQITRVTRTTSKSPAEALEECLSDYRPPVAPETLERQIRLAAAEATDARFVPELFRSGARTSPT
jgi:hypothetical protein